MAERAWNARAWAVIAISTLSLGGCGLGTSRWTEEVQLRDGTLISVDREVFRGPYSGEITSQKPVRPALEERMTIHLPNAADEIVWMEPHRIAVTVERINGHWWVVSRLMTVCHQKFMDQPTYRASVWDGRRWSPASPDASPDIADINLWLGAANPLESAGRTSVTISEKNGMNAAIRARNPRAGRFNLKEGRGCPMESIKRPGGER